jgi:mono/diheme cytochrome c family protein
LAMSEQSNSAAATSELGAEAEEPVAVEPEVDAMGRHSVYSGVYSEAQAARGSAIQAEHCSACHSPDDWGGGNVLQGYTGMSAYDLVNWLRESMPLDEPGRLSLQQYTDLAAYIFKLNGAPAGAEELPADPARLAQVRLEYRRR